MRLIWASLHSCAREPWRTLHGQRRRWNINIPDKHCLWVNLPVPSRLVGQGNDFAQSLLTLGVHSLVEIVFDKIYRRHGEYSASYGNAQFRYRNDEEMDKTLTFD